MQIALLEITGEYAIAVPVLRVILMALLARQVRIFSKQFIYLLLKFFTNTSNFKQFYIQKILVPPPPDPGCKEDRECPSREACFSGDCKDPCKVIQPCVNNAECKVHSTLPLRTMSCICLPGFTGKGDVRCDKISKKGYLVLYLSKIFL